MLKRFLDGCRAVCRKFIVICRGITYLQKKVVWFIVALWIVINLGVAGAFYYWDLDMIQERETLEKHLKVLQDFITNHSGH